MKKKKKIIKPKNKKATVKKLRTEREKKLFKLISENLGKKGKGKSMKELMMNAGYSENTALQQTRILGKVKETKEFKSYIDRLKAHREVIIERMESLIGTAKYGEISMSLSRIENIVLLSEGKPTENVNVLSGKKKDEIDNIFKENS